MKVYISADIEGIASVVDLDQLSSSGPDYARVRRLMTQEVNAAVEGAFAAGAIEVVVSDGHGAGKNLIPEELHEDAYLIAGPLKPVAQMEDRRHVLRSYLHRVPREDGQRRHPFSHHERSHSF